MRQDVAFQRTRLPPALNRLDVVHAAAIPMRAALRTARRGETFQQVWHRAGGPSVASPFNIGDSYFGSLLFGTS